MQAPAINQVAFFLALPPRLPAAFFLPRPP
jgi:hypothetical protein